MSHRITTAKAGHKKVSKHLKPGAARRFTVEPKDGGYVSTTHHNPPPAPRGTTPWDWEQQHPPQEKIHSSLGDVADHMHKTFADSDEDGQ